MALIFKNNVAASIAALTVTASQTTIALTAGHGSRFGTIPVGDYYYATIVSPTSTTNWEVIQITDVTVDLITCVRGIDSSAGVGLGVAWATGDIIELRNPAECFEWLGTNAEFLANMSLSTGSGVQKGDGSGGFTAAISGTDYAPATSGSSVLKGSGSGGFSNAVAGVDYVAPVASTASGLTMSPSRILGRTTAASGAIEEISVGSGLTLSGGTLATSGAASVPPISQLTMLHNFGGL